MDPLLTGTTKRKKILVVDDDRLMRRSVSLSLENAGYRSFTAGSAEESLTLAQEQKPDLILMDIGLPGMDGLEALRRIQNEIGASVILVTARRRELDEILGLELGADDYVTKPFDMDVLLARVKAVLRRASAPEGPAPQEPVVVGNLYIDPVSRLVRVGDREVNLAPKEFDLLYFLAQRTGQVISVDQLITQVWGQEWIGENQTAYVHIRWLRQKIERDPAQPRRLLTVRGAGYKLVPEAI